MYLLCFLTDAVHDTCFDWMNSALDYQLNNESIYMLVYLLMYHWCNVMYQWYRSTVTLAKD